MTELAAIDAKLERLARSLERLAGQGAPDLVLTRAEAARQLKVSVRQLHRLIAAGHLAALPSGVARAELERYIAAPAERLRYRGTRQRAADAKAMARRLRERLKRERRASR